MSKLGFIPFGDRVIVKPDPVPDKVTLGSGLILNVDADKVEQVSGTVMAVGDGVQVPLAVGDRVIYSPYAGFAMKLDNKNYRLLTGWEIVGKRTDEEVTIEMRNE